jgi:hypothetical protein
LTLVPLVGFVTVTVSSVPPVTFTTIGVMGDTTLASSGVTCTRTPAWVAAPPGPLGLPPVLEVHPSTSAAQAASAATTRSVTRCPGTSPRYPQPARRCRRQVCATM